MLPSLRNPPQDKDSQGISLTVTLTHPSPFVDPSTDEPEPTNRRQFLTSIDQHQPPQERRIREHHAPPDQKLQQQSAPGRVSSPQRYPSKVDNIQPTDQIFDKSQQQLLSLPKDNSQPSSNQSPHDSQEHNTPLPVRQQESPPSSQVSDFPRQPQHSSPNHPDSQVNPVTGQPQVTVPVITAYPIALITAYPDGPPPQPPGPLPQPPGPPPQRQPPEKRRSWCCCL